MTTVFFCVSFCIFTLSTINGFYLIYSFPLIIPLRIEYMFTVVVVGFF